MKPVTCGRCGADLATVAGWGERWDADATVWVGFLTCPACGAVYVYQRRTATRSLELQPFLPFEEAPP